MPQKRNSNAPPKVMTWSKAAPVLVVAAVFDALGFMFEWFVFFGPAMVAIYCTVKATGVLTSVTFGLLGTGTSGLVCSAAAIAAGTAASVGLIAFGEVMALAIGLAGWLTVGLILMKTNPRIFKENAIWFGASLLMSEIPLLGSLPFVTIIVGKMYRTQIRIEKAEYKKWEKENAEAQLRERREQEARILQIQAMQQQAANDEMYNQAANDERYNNEEIPEEERMAA